MKKKDLMLAPDELFSVNDRLILESYQKDRSLKSTERNGFAMISQKVSLVGLKILIDCFTEKYGLIKKNRVAYIKEDLLFTQEWAKKTLESPALDRPFVIVDLNFVEFIGPTQDESIDTG
jgi:hypothetical protein